MKVRDSRDCFERVWSAAVGLASGEGELPKRLRGAQIQLAPLLPGDFPTVHLRKKYEGIMSELLRLPELDDRDTRKLAEEILALCIGVGELDGDLQDIILDRPEPTAADLPPSDIGGLRN